MLNILKFIKRKTAQKLSSFYEYISYLLFKITKITKFYDRGFSYLLRKSKQDSNKELWNLISEYYSLRWTNPPDINYLIFIKQYLSEASVILEFGCGAGMNLKWLLKNSSVDSQNVYGIDISEVAIEIAKKEVSIKNCICLDILKDRNFDFFHNNQNTFDLIFTRATLQHLSSADLSTTISDFFKMHLKESGYLVIKECFELNSKFGLIEGHRVHHTFNNNYPEIFRKNFELIEHNINLGVLIFKKNKL